MTEEVECIKIPGHFHFLHSFRDSTDLRHGTTLTSSSIDMDSFKVATDSRTRYVTALF